MDIRKLFAYFHTFAKIFQIISKVVVFIDDNLDLSDQS